MEGNKGIIWTCDPYIEIDWPETESVITSKPHIAWDRTLIVSTEIEQARKDKIDAGFRLLSKWDIVVPINNDKHSLAEAMPEGLKERALKYLPDLRAPLYFTGFIWWSQRAQKTFDLWAEIDQELKHGPLSFMAAVYRTHPFMMAVPSNWIGLPDSDGFYGKKIYVKNTADYDIERAGRVFRAGHKKRMFLPISMEAEIRACQDLIITKE